MIENKEREAYRKACRHYVDASGHCRGLSKCGCGYAYDILCTPDCKCARMKRYDKMNKDK